MSRIGSDGLHNAGRTRKLRQIVNRIDSIRERLSCRRVSLNSQKNKSRQKKHLSLPSYISDILLDDLQLMQFGTTVLHFQHEGSELQITPVVLGIDRYCRTLFWVKPSWSLPGFNMDTPLNSDYIYKGDIDFCMTPSLFAHMQSGVRIHISEIGEGFIDLETLLEVRKSKLDYKENNLNRTDSKEVFSQTEDCLTLSFGIGITDNRTIEFLMPRQVFNVWYHGLCRVVSSVILSKKRNHDPRIKWLSDVFMSLSQLDSRRYVGPTTLEAIKVCNFFFICCSLIQYRTTVHVMNEHLTSEFKSI